jgi:hypothetical protein
LYSLRSFIVVVGRTKSSSSNDNNKGMEGVPNIKNNNEVLFCLYSTLYITFLSLYFLEHFLYLLWAIINTTSDSQVRYHSIVAWLKWKFLKSERYFRFGMPLQMIQFQYWDHMGIDTLTGVQRDWSFVPMHTKNKNGR